MVLWRADQSKVRGMADSIHYVAYTAADVCCECSSVAVCKSDDGDYKQYLSRDCFFQSCRGSGVFLLWVRFRKVMAVQ